MSQLQNVFVSSFIVTERIFFHIKECTDRPVYNNHPCDPQKVVVVQRWLVNGDFSIKIVINISLARLSHC